MPLEVCRKSESGNQRSWSKMLLHGSPRKAREIDENPSEDASSCRRAASSHTDGEESDDGEVSGSCSNSISDDERQKVDQASWIRGMGISLWGCSSRHASAMLHRKRAEAEKEREAKEELMKESDYFQEMRLATAVRRDCPLTKNADHLHGCRRQRSWDRTHDLLRMREVSGTSFRKTHRTKITQSLIPNHKAALLDDYRRSVFCVKFGQDGKVLMSAAQSSKLHFYDTVSCCALRISASDIAYAATRRCIKTVQARDVGWAVIDVDCSPDQRFAIYSSWSDCIHIVNVSGDYELHEPLDFAPEFHACMFGIRFDPTGKTVVAGLNSGQVMVYDVESKRKVATQQAHSDDVNTVCFLTDQPHLFATGSDDSLIQVWDTRCIADPVSVIAGHMLGLTCVESKGDGRYILSNSKDSAMKLWDLRQCSGGGGGKAKDGCRWLRWEGFVAKRAQDASVMTFGQHVVAKTLVRCAFSPLETTAQRYVYSGSSDGGVYVYDTLTGRLAGRPLMGHADVVRQAAWHPTLPELVSSSWDGRCVRWEYRELEAERGLQEEEAEEEEVAGQLEQRLFVC